VTKIIDVSNNNGHVDFVAAKKAGAVGVYLKVTEGTGFVDQTYLAPQGGQARRPDGGRLPLRHIRRPGARPRRHSS
jgi:hypothetical protein